MARTGGHATVTCAVGWRCVGSEHRVPGFGRAGVHAKLNVLSRFHIQNTPVVELPFREFISFVYFRDFLKLSVFIYSH